MPSTGGFVYMLLPAFKSYDNYCFDPIAHA